MSFPYGGVTTPAIAIRPGLGNVQSYAIAARPWLSGSNITGTIGEVKMEFPYVARSFTVINTGTEVIRVHFDSLANVDVVNHHHYVALGNQGDSMVFAVRCKEFYVSKGTANLNTASFDAVVELTSILAADITVHSGSGVNS